MKRLIVGAPLLLFICTACFSNAKTPYVRYPNQPLSRMKPVSIDKRSNGLIIEVLRLGEGRLPGTGDHVYMHFTGWLADSGRKFDSSVDRGPYLEYRVGIDEIHKGWEEGVKGMRVGGKRRVTIPAELAYGAKGKGPVPPNSRLIYEIDLLHVKAQ